MKVMIIHPQYTKTKSSRLSSQDIIKVSRQLHNNTFDFVQKIIDQFLSIFKNITYQL